MPTLKQRKYERAHDIVAIARRYAKEQDAFRVGSTNVPMLVNKSNNNYMNSPPRHHEQQQQPQWRPGGRRDLPELFSEQEAPPPRTSAAAAASTEKEQSPKKERRRRKQRKVTNPPEDPFARQQQQQQETSPRPPPVQEQQPQKQQVPTAAVAAPAADSPPVVAADIAVHVVPTPPRVPKAATAAPVKQQPQPKPAAAVVSTNKNDSNRKASNNAAANPTTSSGKINKPKSNNSKALAAATTAATTSALMLDPLVADLSQVREYLQVGHGDNKVTPAELRMLLSKLSHDEIREHWFAVVGGRADFELAQQQQQQQHQQAAKAKSTTATTRTANKADVAPPPSPTKLIESWIHGTGTKQEHDTLMAQRRITGFAVMSDSSGLSKLSQRRPLLEVLRLIHEPKSIIAAYGLVGCGGRTIGNWVADNTASFYPMSSSSLALPSATTTTTAATKTDAATANNSNNSSKYINKPAGIAGLHDFSKLPADKTAASTPIAAQQHERDLVEGVIRTMIVAQHVISRTAMVQVGMGCHFGTFYRLGDSLFGHEAEHVELLAEDFCDGKEIAITGLTARKFFLPHAGDDDEEQQEQQRQKAQKRFFDVVRRKNDEMEAFRIVPVIPDAATLVQQQEASATTATNDNGSSNNFDEDDFEFSLDFEKKKPQSKEEVEAERAKAVERFMHEHVLPEVVRNTMVAKGLLNNTTKTFDQVYYPSGFDNSFFSFIQQNPVSKIAANASAVSSLIHRGIYLLVKIRSVEHDLLLDQLVQRMYVREEIQIAVTAANKIEAGNNIKLIKCNGDIAILVAMTLTAALNFSFKIYSRMEELGASFSCSIGAWQGSAYVFDLSDGRGLEYDVAGGPVNVASKLAEDFDFGVSGIFFGKDIFFNPSASRAVRGDRSGNELDDEDFDANGDEDEDEEPALEPEDGEQLVHLSRVRARTGDFAIGGLQGQGQQDGDVVVLGTALSIVKSGVRIDAVKVRELKK